MLDAHLDKAKGDFAVNTPNDMPGYHPHMTLPLLKARLREDFSEFPKLIYFTVIRHPLTMLWSYFKYFQPDSQSRYNYQQNWEKESLMCFEDWLETGRVGMDPRWLELAPSFVSPKDLSPLSLEAHIHESDNKITHECTVIKLEELDDHMQVFSVLSGLPNRLRPKHVNRSNDSLMPVLSQRHVDRIRTMFPLESVLYDF